jgi:hypothetical protein
VHDIVRDQLFHQEPLPIPVTPDTRPDGQVLANQGERAVCPVLLQVAEDGVEPEQGGNDDGFEVLPEEQLQRHRTFKHPGDRRPELPDERPNGLATLLGDGVATEDVTALPSLRARETVQAIVR